MRFGHYNLGYIHHMQIWWANHEDVSMGEEATYSLPHKPQQEVKKKNKQKKQLHDVKLKVKFHTGT